MNFLINCGISKDIINQIEYNNSDQMLEDAEWNMDRVVSSIKYLKEIGINQINNILINRFDIVMRGRKSLEKQIDRKKDLNIVEAINSDFSNLYYLDQI